MELAFLDNLRRAQPACICKSNKHVAVSQWREKREGEREGGSVWRGWESKLPSLTIYSLYLRMPSRKCFSAMRVELAFSAHRWLAHTSRSFKSNKHFVRVRLVWSWRWILFLPLRSCIGAVHLLYLYWMTWQCVLRASCACTSYPYKLFMPCFFLSISMSARTFDLILENAGCWIGIPSNDCSFI